MDVADPVRGELRTALYQHAFNPTRPAEPGSASAQILDWAQQASLPVGCLSEPAVLRTALEALRFRLDGSRAAANTIIRKRAVLHGALSYAAESGLLPDNPLDSTSCRGASVIRGARPRRRGQPRPGRRAAGRGRPAPLRPAACRLVAVAELRRRPGPDRRQAGNSVAVLLTVYTHCIHGHDDLLNQQIGRVLGPPEGRGPRPSAKKPTVCTDRATRWKDQRLHRPR